jgi:GPH family glycoside/pentoside/hexuronide:cation symporter
MKLSEKIGYGFGDMSSSMFWKLFSYFLPFFYSNVFGLSLADAAVLMLVTRIWDAVSDPMMGIIADRTKTRWGKYRPYLLFFAIPFAVCGVLLFTTPENGKVVWAYVTYLLMMTVYTGINVPYGSLLNVMTADSDEKSVLSSYRMFFAYGGSFIALFAWEPSAICLTRQE